jgi:hypothetical protein
MRMLAVLALALCCHGGSASDYRSMLSTHLLKAGCGSAQIAESNRCISAAFGTITGSDTCENFGVFSPCWPPCYCDSPKGFRQLVQEFKPQCTSLPPCGAARPAPRAARAKHAVGA